jgi:hypothetical protein
VKLSAPVLAFFLLSPLGCAFEAADIDAWRSVQNGKPRLAGYLADAKRPTELRVRAAKALFEEDQLPYIMAVVKAATPEQKKLLAQPLSAMAISKLGDADRKTMVRARSLAYHLLEFEEALGAGTAELADALAQSALKSVPPKMRDAIGPKKALLGAAVAHPPIVDQIVKAAEAAAPDPAAEARFLTLLEYIGDLRTPDAARTRARLLLMRARAVYPKISGALAQAMLVDRNPTLLKFLIELTRDPTLSEQVRNRGFVAMGRMGKDAIPGMMRVVQTDFPTPDDARYLALRGLWEAGGPAYLGAALRALPAEGKWPVKGTEFRDDIDAFCDNRVATKKAAAKPVLVELLNDSNWIARAYALRCITRLYPDEAAELVSVLQDDLTPLPGWDESGEPSSFAAAVKALKEG